MMTKKIVSIVFCVAFLFSNFVLYASAESSADAFRVLSFEYIDAESKLPVSTLNAGRTLEAVAQVRRVGSPEKATLIAAVYHDGQLFDLSSQTIQFSDLGEEQTFTVTVTLPDDVRNCMVSGYLWDDYLGMEPLSCAASFASNNPGVVALYVDGNEVENFNKSIQEYSIELPASSSDTPEVVAVCEDLTTKSYVEYTEGNKIVLKTVAPGGASESYTLHTTKAEPYIRDVYTVFTNQSTQVKEELTIGDTAVHNPVYRYDESGETILPFGNDFFTRTSKVYNDRSYFFYNRIPEELEGFRPIYFNYDWRAFSSQPFVTTFTINKSARLYFSASDEQARKNGYDRVTFENSPLIETPGNDWNAVTVQYSPKKDAGHDWYPSLKTAEFIVPEGVKSKTFTIYGDCSAYGGPLMFFKFIEPGDAPPVIDELPELPEEGLTISDVSVSYIKDNAEATETINTFNVLKKPDYKYDADNKPIAFGNSGAAVWGAQPPILTQIFTDSYKYVKTFPEEMNGAINIRFKRAHGTANYGDEFTLTFTINRSATLYFDSDDAHIAEYGAEKMESGIGYDETDNWYDAIANHIPKPDAPGTLLHGGRLYKMQLTVPEGEESATFTVVLCNGKPWDGPIAFIK